jgi:hypothetical protein
MKETEIIQLLAAFLIEFATAKVDARTLPPEVLYRRIGKIKECMPEMIDYLRREAPRGVYDGINGLYEEFANEADIRKRYLKLMQAYLLALMYLLMNTATLLEKAEEYLKTQNKA